MFYKKIDNVTNSQQVKNSSFKLLKRTLIYVKPYWLHMIGIFSLKLIETPFALLKPYALKVLIDSGFGSVALPGFITFFFAANYNFTFETIVWISVGLVLIVAFIENILQIISWILNTYTGEKIILRFRTLIFNKVQRLSLSYHDKVGTSDSIYRLQYDTSSFKSFLINNISKFFSSTIKLISMMVVMFLINWQFALIALTITPPLIFLLRISSKRLKKDWKKLKNDESKSMALVQEVLTSLRIVKAFGQEEREEKRYISKANTSFKSHIQVAWTSSLFSFAMGIMVAISTSLFIYFGAKYVNSGLMTLGELTLLLSYLTQFIGPLEKISKTMNEVQSTLTSIDRVFYILDKENEVAENKNAIKINKVKGEVSFENVSFHYENDRNILQNVTFQINPGDRVGIMGSTGSGKTSLINLITRFYDPTEGRILVDGIDIKNYKLEEYRKQFAIVLQEPVLFSTTIEENIAYGRLDCTKEEIIEAAKFANAHSFIEKSINGYDTVIGERGMTLSGGERQRISIARAFIKNAPILILDEPTSSLDIRTESQIMEAMEKLMEGRTTFLITHRPDNLKRCNVVIHIEKGRLKEVILNDNLEFRSKTTENLIYTA